MKTTNKTFPAMLLSLATLLGILPATSHAASSTAFTYQGRLTAGGAPANSVVDMEFRLYDMMTAGSQIGMTLTNENVTVTNGVFTTSLDFGAGIFNGSTYWLETAIRPGASMGTFSSLLPRQPVTGAPYAFYALTAGTAMSAAMATTANAAAAVPWAGIVGVPAGFADGVDNDTTYTAGTGLDLDTGEFSVRFSGAGVATSASRSDHTHRQYWDLDGNSGTTDGVDFIGTSDRRSLDFRINNFRALRLQLGSLGPIIAPTVIGGASDNTVTAGLDGVTIGGGAANTASENYATISGGYDNESLLRAPYTKIPGGRGARAERYGQMAHANGTFSTGGDAQASTYILRNQSTGTGWTELFLDGATERLIVPVNSALCFTVHIVAREDGNVAGAFEAKGVAKRQGSAVSLVNLGQNPINANIIASDETIWQARVRTDDPRNALVVEVRNVIGTNVRWVARVETVEVRY